MKKIKMQPLTAEAFAPFGTFTNILEPKGNFVGGPNHDFYRDNSRFFCESSLPVGLSPLVVRKQPLVLDSLEYHTATCEAILPISGDAILHVTPAGGAPDTNLTKVFLLPKGTMVTLFPGVYHLCPLPLDADVLHSLVILPERAYANDFTLVELAADEQFEIEL